MPPASNTAFGVDRLRQYPLGTSPDTDNLGAEAEPQPRLSKKAKKKKDRLAAQIPQESSNGDQPNSGEIAVSDPSPSPPIVQSDESLIRGIPRTFPSVQQSAPPPDDLFEGEAVDDSYDPHLHPSDDWHLNNVTEVAPVKEPPAPVSFHGSHPAQPGFSTRGFVTARSPPVSPPQRYSRPVSYGGSVPPLPTHPRASSSPYSRTTSLYGSPPAPHLPQQHFYNARDVDLGQARQNLTHVNIEPTLVKQTILPSQQGQARQGIILGFDGRLSILSIEHGKCREVGAISGLGGIVVDAVLLSLKSTNPNLASGNPFAAILIHGPKETPTAEVTVAAHPDPTTYSNVSGTEYTTRLEIFSLSLQQRVATIFETSSSFSHPVYRGGAPEPPPPIGDFKLFSSGKTLVAASGTSGEVFIFCPLEDGSSSFECLAKLWTSLQPQMRRRDSSHGGSVEAGVSPADSTRGSPVAKRAIVDLNGRWLAICPAEASSKPALRIQLGADVVYRREAGVESVGPPTRPNISCEVDSPDADTIFSKVARVAAQEFVKGAKWLGDQGYQTWQNYWKKEQSTASSVQNQHFYNASMYPMQTVSNDFPPTHADELPVPKHPELVSIFDLVTMHDPLAKRPLDEPIPSATFQPPRGCSFVSFGPHGLTLLTASRKGDVQYIWDLMQTKHCRAQVVFSDEDKLRSQPRVRQLARYERLSSSTIVDVAWEMPNGTRFAVLTTNKTVHIFDLPPNALRWPPPRLARKSRPNVKTSGVSDVHAEIGQGGFFSSAMSIASKAQPMVAGWRGRAPSLGGGLAGLGQTGLGIASATGARGGKAVAAGLSRSLGAATETVNNIRHAGENRLHLKLRQQPHPARLYWTRQGYNVKLAVIDSEKIQLQQVQRPKSQGKGRRDTNSVFASRKAQNITMLRHQDLQPESTMISQVTRDSVFAEKSHPTYTSFCRIGSPKDTKSQVALHPLSYAEIETNVAFQPFHSDRRVFLSVYNNGRTSITAPSPKRTMASAKAWTFGDEIATIKLNTYSAHVLDEEPQDSVIYRETTVTSMSGDNDMEQIVSTTRRSKKKKHTHGQMEDEEEAKDDFFEDDCEVLDFATDRV